MVDENVTNTPSAQLVDQMNDVHIVREDEFSPNEKLIGATEFISPLSGDLFKIQGLIATQLIALNEMLAARNNAIFKQTTKKYGTLTKKFLVTLEQYLGSTLVDLFRLVDRIAPLMENYDYDLEFFEKECPSTPQDVEQFVQDVKKMVEVHATTVSELSVTSMQLEELGDKYSTNSQRAASSSETARAVSISLAVGGAAAGVGAALFFAPFTAVGTVLVISGGGGGISGLLTTTTKRRPKSIVTPPPNST